jgi:uncharacterized delta-60 repeat protein
MKNMLCQSKKMLLLLSVFFSCSLFAQDGTLDNTFGTNGKASFTVSGLQDAANAFALQADGKMVTAGTYINGGSWDFVVVRLNTDGSPDNTFGTAGKVTTSITSGNDVPYRLAIQTDGKIVVAGYGNNGANNDVIVVRYNTNGTLDNTFDGDGKVITNLGSNEAAFALTIQPDGKIIAAGASTSGGQQEATAFRYNTDGSPDNTFDGDGVVVFSGPLTNDNIREVAVQTDGKIIMAGADNYSGGNFHGELVRLNADGSPDNSFGTNGLVTLPLNYGIFYGMTLQTDGKIVGVGTGNTSMNPGSTGSLIARFNTDGTPDNTFNGNGYHLGYIGYTSGLTGVQQDANGKLVGVGFTRFTDPVTAAITYDFLVERYTTGGSLDNTFDGDGVLVVQFGFNVDDGASLPAIQPNGKILASGFVTNGGSQNFAIIRINSALSTLPVSLVNFFAYKQTSSVVLNWQTVSEQNNRGFEIQRSADGITFFAIGWVNAVGNSISTNDYSFIDVRPLTGKNFYRLRQIDLDNKSKLSVIRKVDFDKLIDLSIYPNPVTDLLNVQLSKNITEIKILDMQGKTVWQQQNTGNLLLVSIPVQKLSNGIYVLKVSDREGNRGTQKFIKE